MAGPLAFAGALLLMLASLATAQQHGTWEPGPGAQNTDTGPVPDCPNPGDVQTGDGSCVDPITQAAGAAGEVQYNDGGSFAGDPDLTWDDASKLLTIGAVTGTAGLKLPLQADAVTPTLSFGDGDTGFFERLDDRIGIAVDGVPQWDIQGPAIGGWNCTEPTMTTAIGGSGGFGWACSNAEALYRAGTGNVRIKAGTVDVVDITATQVTVGAPVLGLTPQATAPTCPATDAGLYFDSSGSGALCACPPGGAWSIVIDFGSGNCT